ncbi:hypothetical protein ABZ260_40905 [Streptosporangium sp. NPDC006013]|uniref:hypothetical protein n=1 Tax=Streptosporangium sp. NPDC006013 TaxID=3155596 RepID=UPI0033B79C87
MVSTFDGRRANLMTSGFNVDDHNLWILKGERAWIDPGRRGTGEFHHRGNGTFAGNATILDLRHRMYLTHD